MSQLTIEPLRPAQGAEAKSVDRVTVHYGGALADGTTFEISRGPGERFPSSRRTPSFSSRSSSSRSADGHFTR